jgi:hypothetical protein
LALAAPAPQAAGARSLPGWIRIALRLLAMVALLGDAQAALGAQRLDVDGLLHVRSGR